MGDLDFNCVTKITFNTHFSDIITLLSVRSAYTQRPNYANDSQASVSHCASVMYGHSPWCLNNMFVSILIFQEILYIKDQTLYLAFIILQISYAYSVHKIKPSVRTIKIKHITYRPDPMKLTLCKINRQHQFFNISWVKHQLLKLLSNLIIKILNLLSSLLDF